MASSCRECQALWMRNVAGRPTTWYFWCAFLPLWGIGIALSSSCLFVFLRGVSSPCPRCSSTSISLSLPLSWISTKGVFGFAFFLAAGAAPLAFLVVPETTLAFGATGFLAAGLAGTFDWTTFKERRLIRNRCLPSLPLGKRHQIQSRSPICYRDQSFPQSRTWRCGQRKKATMPNQAKLSHVTVTRSRSHVTKTL